MKGTLHLAICLVWLGGCRAPESIPPGPELGSWGVPVEDSPPIRDLAELTLERRAQGRPDPLSVEVSFLSDGPYVKPNLPVIGVKLALGEGETECFLVTDERFTSGFHPYWDLFVTDLEGRPVGAFKGLRTIEWFHAPTLVTPDDTWGRERALSGVASEESSQAPIDLAVAEYWRLDVPGTYRVRAVYFVEPHFQGNRDYDDEVVFESEALEFKLLSEPERWPRLEAPEAEGPVPRDSTMDDVIRVDRR